MKVIKRKLLESNSDQFSKIVFWSACTLIWNGSLRVHEALSRLQSEFDEHSTLLGEDFQMITEPINKKDRTFIRIVFKSPKENRVGRDMCLEIFGNDTFLCPVRAINKYLHEKSKYNINNNKKPFFMMQKDTQKEISMLCYPH